VCADLQICYLCGSASGCAHNKSFQRRLLIKMLINYFLLAAIITARAVLRSSRREERRGREKRVRECAKSRRSKREREREELFIAQTFLIYVLGRTSLCSSHIVLIAKYHTCKTILFWFTGFSLHFRVQFN